MTFADIAAELGVDERTARRVVDTVIAKLRAGFSGTEHAPETVVRAIVLVLGEREVSATDETVAENFSSTENATFSRPSRRFVDPLCSWTEGAEHAVGLSTPSPPSSPCSDGERRARHAVPRRFPPRR